MYVHHYIMFSNPDPETETGPTHSGGFCSNLANVWGIGAELRGVTYAYPKGAATATSSTSSTDHFPGISQLHTTRPPTPCDTHYSPVFVGC